MKRRLTGDHNQCAGCEKYFNSSNAFDKHRTGEHGKDRRCMSTEEMTGKGMATNKGGWWVGSLRDENASPWSSSDDCEPSN
jgi:hypothetical protein